VRSTIVHAFVYSWSVMTDAAINAQQRTALVERIACYTVGIAGNENTCIGTGTLATIDQQHLVITAEHVLKGVDVEGIRFWCRPSAPIIEKAAKDLSRSEIGRLTAGQKLPIETIITDPVTDLAAIKLFSDFKLPEPCEFYSLDKSRQLARWPEDDLDGLSLIYFGFPAANSLPLWTVGDNTYHYLGCAHGVCHYDKALNTPPWNKFPVSISPDKDFLLKYSLSPENIAPQGFSGCGVWVGSENPESLVWGSEPLMIGTIHSYLEKSSLLVATKIAKILEIARFTAQGRFQKPSP
jgi:hypothetical protein